MENSTMASVAMPGYKNTIFLTENSTDSWYINVSSVEGTTAAQWFLEEYLGHVINGYGAVILGSFGVLTNILILLVLGRKGYLTTTDIYLINLAIMDLLYNLIHRLYRFTPKFFMGIDPIQLHPWLCKSWVFSVMVAMTASGWTIMAMTFERLIVVYYPLKVKLLLSKCLSKIVCMVIDLSCCALYLMYFWTHGAIYKDTPDGPVIKVGCTAGSYVTTRYYMKHYRPYQDFIFLVGIPVVFIFTCNSMIIFRLAKDVWLSEAVTPTGDIVERRKAKNKSLTITLLIVSFTYVVCLTPYRVMMIVDGGSTPFSWKITQQWQAVTLLRWGIALTIANINYSINFILYCLCGKEFR